MSLHNLPISRKFTYADFLQDDDIAYVSYGSHYNNINISFIVSEKRVYRVLTNDKKSPLGELEYIIKKNFKNKDSSKFDYQGTLEFKDIPNAKKIVITEIEGDKLNEMGYFTQEELVDYAKQNLNLKLLIGRGIFVTNTTYLINDLIITIKCEHDESFCDIPICKITPETEISISENIDSSVKVSKIYEVDSKNVIEISISDENKEQTKKYEKTFNLTELLAISMGSSKTDKKLENNEEQIKKYILKEDLIGQIIDKLMLTRFKIGNNLKVMFENMFFNINICGLNITESKDIAFIVKNRNVHINIEDLLSNIKLLNRKYKLKENDALIFNIISSNLKIISKHDLLNKIREQLQNKTILKGEKITIYIGTNRMILMLDDVFINFTDSMEESDKMVYVYDSLYHPIININDNTLHGIYVTDQNEKYDILAIEFKAVKKEIIENYDLSSLLKIVSNVDVNIENVRNYFKNKFNNSCVFIGRIYEYMGVKYIVEKIQYLDSSANSKHKLIGTFTKFTEMKFNKELNDKTINLIDNCDQTCRNIDIKTIKTIVEQMEKEGLYGMTEYIDKFIKEVLLTRTNLIDENLLDLIEPIKGVILYGPPGTGKTTLARNICKIFDTTGSRIKQITATEIKSKWHGESEGNIRKLFSHAILDYEKYGKNAPLHILIIDEIDAILGARGNSICDVKDSIVNQILGEMDGLVQFDNIIIIGITNRLELLDKACLRPGRFGCHIHVKLPNEDQRKLIFEAFHRKLEKANIIDKSSEFNYQLIANVTDKLSGADIKHIYQLATNEHINKKMEGIVYHIDQQLIFSLLNKYYDINI